MKKGISKQADADKNGMRREYDFKNMAGGVRGKYCKAYRQGHTVKIKKSDGSTATRHFTLKDGAVLLEPAVKKYFPDSETVNKVLRSLITLIPQK